MAIGLVSLFITLFIFSLEVDMSSLLKITLLELSMVMIITHAAMGGDSGAEGCYCDTMSWEGVRTQRENMEVDKMDDKASEIDEASQMDNDKTVQRQARIRSCSTNSDCKGTLNCVRRQNGKIKWCKSGM